MSAQEMNEQSQPAPLDLIAMALAEDIGSGDKTTELLIDPQQPGRAVIIARQDLVCCGLDVVEHVVARINAEVLVRRLADEGENVLSGVKLAVLPVLHRRAHSHPHPRACARGPQH